MNDMECITRGSILAGDILKTDIYTRHGVLFMVAGHKVTKENELRLLKQDFYMKPSYTNNVCSEQVEPVEHILLPEPSFQHSIASQKPKEIFDKENPEKTESKVHALTDSLYRNLMDVYSEIYRHGLSETRSNLILEKVVDKAVGELLTRGRWYFDFNAWRVADNYSQVHAVNVALISALMGYELGYKSKQLCELILAAFIHDLGRKRIPLLIMNKQGPLTPQEFTYVKKHVNLENIDLPYRISDSAKEVVLQHHEQWNGSGYPKGLTQNMIHPFAQIVAVADVFDALISDRPYRQALSLNDAFEWIMAGSGTLFNPEVVKLFVKVITLYPLGTIVKFKTGETGRVTKESKFHPNRPEVRLVLDSRGQYIQDYIISDLNICHTMIIKNIEYPK